VYRSVTRKELATGSENRLFLGYQFPHAHVGYAVLDVDKTGLKLQTLSTPIEFVRLSPE
jgi:hypothetical protein